MEDGDTSVATVNDVVGVTALLSSRNSWHQALLTRLPSGFN
jgi:hypothetical protein